MDSISKKVFCEFKDFTGANETSEAKRHMERGVKAYGVKVRSFRADNGIFKSTDFRIELQDNNQNITFCGVEAHHQNGDPRARVEIYLGAVKRTCCKCILCLKSKDRIHKCSVSFGI